MKRFIVWLFLFADSVLLVCFFDQDKIEIRNGILYNLITGTLPLLLLIILLTKLFFDIQIYEYIKWKTARYIIVTIIAFVDISLIILTMVFTMWAPTEMNDVIVYQNSTNKKEKIICQFYWSGIIDNNTNWRVIKTKRINAILRPIEVISDSLLIKELKLYGIPEVKANKDYIWYAHKKYELQRFMIFDGNASEIIKVR